MTESLLGKTTAEAHELFEKFHAMVMSSEEPPSLSLDKLAVLAGVRSFPARVKCATLAWHTLEAALKQQNAPVTTE
jgi:nitrogen fixation NifU-like protein